MCQRLYNAMMVFLNMHHDHVFRTPLKEMMTTCVLKRIPASLITEISYLLFQPHSIVNRRNVVMQGTDRTCKR